MLPVSTSPAFGGLSSFVTRSKTKVSDPQAKTTPIALLDIPSNGKASSFVANASISQALKWTPLETFTHLNKLISNDYQRQLYRGDLISSPLAKQGVQNSEWLKQTKIIGINPRAVGTYLNILKAGMIYPERSVHILPCYETDNASLYEPQSWKLSREFMDPALSKMGFKTPEQQVGFVVSALHAMGKTVGMDVLPHTAAYSKESIVNPEQFDWFHLNSDRSGQLYPKASRFEALPSWEKKQVTGYYLRHMTSNKVYDSLLQDIKKQERLDPDRNISTNLNTYLQVLDAIRQVYYLNPIELEIKGWLKYKAMIDKKNYLALDAPQKEVLQRVYEAQHQSEIKPDAVALFFKQNLATEPSVDAPTQAVQKTIIDYLKRNGDATGQKLDHADHFFNLPVAQREKILWGSDNTPKSSELALARRIQIIGAIQNNRLYPEPVANSDVLRPIRFDRMFLEKDAYPTFDKLGLKTLQPQEFFGTLTPYRFYPVKSNGYLNTQHPDMKVFNSFARHVADMQRTIGFDFIRADMAHLQQSHATDQPDNKKPIEFWAYMKQFIQQQAPYFGVYGEHFMNGTKPFPEIADLNQKKIDIVSGDIDYWPVNEDFMGVICNKTTLKNANFKETLSVVTHDSDQAAHRYLNQSPLAVKTRYFLSLFQANPGYSMAGYESRPRSLNQDYLFPQKKPFDWGNDQMLLNSTQAMRQQYAKMDPGFSAPWRQQWLSSQEKGAGGWTWTAPNAKQPQWLMVSNTDLDQPKESVLLSNPFALPPRQTFMAKPVLSTASRQAHLKSLKVEKGRIVIPELQKGENQIYQLNPVKAGNTAS